MSDVPERRRANQSSTSDKSSVNPLKKYRVPLIILLLWGAIVAYNVMATENATACPGHWHSTTSVYVEGERVFFTANPQYTLEGGTMPLATHIHSGSESVWHFEPSKMECIPLRDALRRVDMTIDDDYMQLDSDYHADQGWGGTYTTNETHSVQAWMKTWQGDWESVDVSDLAKMQVPDGAQVIISYGVNDEAALATMQETATPIPNNQTPADANAGAAFPWGPVLGVSGFAIVGLLVWRSFTKGLA